MNTGHLEQIGRRYTGEVRLLARSETTTEESFYPAVRALLAELLQEGGLPFHARVGTSEDRVGGGTDRPDVAIYDDAGAYLAVGCEVKLPDADLRELARSTSRNNQIGRYLAQTGVILLVNVRAVGLLSVRPGVRRDPRRAVMPEDRDLLSVVELWSEDEDLRKARPVRGNRLQELAVLLESAVTEFAPIADPATLARILAVQARRAKADLPARFDAVQGLLEDYGVALGLTFEGEEGLEFFRSSLIQTAFYGLFAGWALWHRENDGTQFAWDRLDRYLKIPFLGKLFYEFRHPDRLEELHLAKHLDRATLTLSRVDRVAFFDRFHPPSLRQEMDLSATAITYFYEPFLEAFDPQLRKELGVWYTPPEIVRYQVRKIDRLLREELGCSRGFADGDVVVLDPCCGTGAYLIEAIRCVAEQLHAEGENGMLGAQILEAVCGRVIGFEILTAPFVIAQLQLYLLLADLGAFPGREHRPAVFLTNALTGWEGPEQVKWNFPELQQEHDAARSVKRGARIIVMLGNPPYNRFAGAAIKQEADLVDHYKGIVRDEKDRQKGQSLLFKRWGVRKHLLDDLYIRFFRLAEKRIGEVAEHGIISFISNSSFLTGRSHPLMRESLLRNFHAIWVDNLHGNRLASERTPWGESCETMFSTTEGAGIKVGTCVTTYLKRRADPTPAAQTEIHHRDFWGRAVDKRRALLESLDLMRWPPSQRAAAMERPEGPRPYEAVVPTDANRWMLSPRDVNAGFEAWPALDELFPASFQGVNPNRGLDGSVVDVDRVTLRDRMNDYFSFDRFSKVKDKYPVLCEPRAGYEPEEVWSALREGRGFQEASIVPYLLFPLDQRWVFYDESERLLNRRRPEFWENLRDNEFLVTVPQPRRASETRPLLAATLVDLHVHDRGSVCFPARFKPPPRRDERTFLTGGANLAPKTWEMLRRTLDLRGDLEGPAARQLVGRLFRLALAILHAPQYEQDHQDGLAQDWAHIPIPKDGAMLQRAVDLGARVGALLDATAGVNHILREMLGATARSLGVVTTSGGGPVHGDDLVVTVSYYGAAKGKWRERDYEKAEAGPASWGPTTGDLFINDHVFVRNVPSGVWRYELGGYPVLKKWLGYRQQSRRDGRPLTDGEARHLRSMVQRIAALLALHPQLDASYTATVDGAWNAEELGLR